MNQRTSKPTDTETQGEAKQPKPSPSGSLAIECKTPNPNGGNGKNHRCQKEKSSLAARIEAGCAVALVIITGCYAYYAALQHSAILESNKINREALESVQRAFVALEDIDFHVGYRIVPPHDKLWEFSAVFENTGMTPAVLNTRYLDVGNELPNGPSIEQFLGDPRRWITMPAEIGAKSTRRIGAIQESESFVLGGFSLSASDREKVARLLKLGKVCIWGWVAYRDVFPHTPPHITEFCEHIVGIESDAKPIRVHTQPCKEHNCSDERCNEYATITNMLPK
jgi:hypothetical protein